MNEELLKDGKLKATTLDSIKQQVDLLMKARFSLTPESTLNLSQTASDIQKKVDDLVQPLSDIETKPKT